MSRVFLLKFELLRVVKSWDYPLKVRCLGLRGGLCLLSYRLWCQIDSLDFFFFSTLLQSTCIMMVIFVTRPIRRTFLASMLLNQRLARISELLSDFLNYALSELRYEWAASNWANLSRWCTFYAQSRRLCLNLDLLGWIRRVENWCGLLGRVHRWEEWTVVGA